MQQRSLKVPVNKSVQTVIQILSVLYLMLWSVAPPLQMDMIYRLVALGLAFVWFFIEFVSRFEFTPMQIWCALFMVAVALVAYMKGGFGSVMGEIAVYMMVLSFFINIYSEGKWQNYSMIVPVTLALLIFFNYRTSQALRDDPTIARLLVRDTEELYDYMRKGIGGYGLVYPQVVAAPVVYGWTLKSFDKNKLFTILGVLWTISFWMVLLNCGYSIAIITSAVSALIFLFYRRRSVWPAFVAAVVVIAATVLMLVYVEGFRNVVLRIFDGTKVVRKIEDLLSTAEGETADSFATRVERYWMSIKTSFQYPLVGSVFFDGGSVGGHSQIFDFFARYGVWGGIPMIYMIFFSPGYFKNASRSLTVRVTANANTIAIALVALFDPFVFQVFFVILILCPIMYSDMMTWTGELDEYTVDG